MAIATADVFIDSDDHSPVGKELGAARVPGDLQVRISSAPIAVVAAGEELSFFRVCFMAPPAKERFPGSHFRHGCSFTDDTVSAGRWRMALGASAPCWPMRPTETDRESSRAALSSSILIYVVIGLGMLTLVPMLTLIPPHHRIRQPPSRGGCWEAIHIVHRHGLPGQERLPLLLMCS